MCRGLFYLAERMILLLLAVVQFFGLAGFGITAFAPTRGAIGLLLIVCGLAAVVLTILENHIGDRLMAALARRDESGAGEVALVFAWMILAPGTSMVLGRQAATALSSPTFPGGVWTHTSLMLLATLGSVILAPAATAGRVLPGRILWHKRS